MAARARAAILKLDKEFNKNIQFCKSNFIIIIIKV